MPKKPNPRGVVRPRDAVTISLSAPSEGSMSHAAFAAKRVA